MSSRVVSLRLPDDLYEELTQRAGEEQLSRYISRVLSDHLAGRMVSPAQLTRQPEKPQAAEPDPFFSSTTPVGTPRACPRCARPRPTYTYKYDDGGTWSCPTCWARGRWYHERAIVITDIGAARDHWAPDPGRNDAA